MRNWIKKLMSMVMVLTMFITYVTPLAASETQDSVSEELEDTTYGENGGGKTLESFKSRM